MDEQKIEAAIDDQTFTGTLRATEDTITVSYEGREKSAQVGSMPPLTVARTLLVELVAAGPSEREQAAARALAASQPPKAAAAVVVEERPSSHPKARASDKRTW